MLLVGAVLLALLVLEMPWAAIVVAVAAVVEVGEAFFWVWLSRRRAVQVGAEALVGATARVVSDCRPRGLVRVQGELWQAYCEEGADAGETVRVTAIEGLTLEVARIH